MNDESGSTLTDELQKREISLPAKTVRLLETYCEALWEWNAKLNLTRHTDYQKFVSRDLIDTIHLAAHLQIGEHILDVGSGGGVPGVVLAILRPDLTVEVCDATGKKARALGEIVDRCGLNLNVWQAKAEDLLRVHRFHTLTVRAVAKMKTLLEMFAPSWNSFGRLVMIKGPAWVEERGEARHYGRLTNFELRKIDEYVHPDDEHQSVILQICRKCDMPLIEKRLADLAAGVPIEAQTEGVGVDNRAPSPPKKSSRRFSPRGKTASAPNEKKSSLDSNSGRGQKSGERRLGGKSLRDSKSAVDPSKKRGKGWVHPETPFSRPSQKKSGAPKRSGRRPPSSDK